MEIPLDFIMRFKLDFPISSPRVFCLLKETNVKKAFFQILRTSRSFAGFFPFLKLQRNFVSSSSSPSFLITRGAQTQGHPIFKQGKKTFFTQGKKLTKVTGAKIHISSKNSHSSQNSPFHNLNFHKILIFEITFSTKFTFFTEFTFQRLIFQKITFVKSQI